MCERVGAAFQLEKAWIPSTSPSPVQAPEEIVGRDSTRGVLTWSKHGEELGGGGVGSKTKNLVLRTEKGKRPLFLGAHH